MYRVYRYTQYPQYWPSEATVYVDSAPGTVEEYVTDNNGTPTLVGNYIGTVTYPTFASFPTVGRTNRLYIDGSTNILYRWTGSAYVSVGGTPTIPTLDEVLSSGDSSLSDANVGNVGIWDSAGGYYVLIRRYNGGMEFKSPSGTFFTSSLSEISFGDPSAAAILSNVSLTAPRTYSFPNASGTIALTSDIAITGVTVSAPLDSSGGSTPNITTKMLTNKLIGRSTAGTGVMEEIAIGSGLSLSAGTLSATGGGGGGLLHGTTSGTDTYTVTIAGAPAYADGDAYLIRFAIGNTTNATLNINSQGARPLYRNNDGPLLGGDVIAGGEMICVYNSTTNVFQCIGVSPNSLIAYVTNADSVTITKGMPVYAFGGTGDRMTVKKAYNTTDATSAQTVGLVLSTSIAANQKGLIMMQGLLDGLSILPTSTFADGDPIYLGATAGTITNVKPHAPNHLVYLGVVTTASPGAAGRMYVKIQNGYELDELHNVQAQSPTLKDTLWYDNTVSPAQWKTASIATVLGYTPIQLSSLSGTYPVSYNSGTGAISIPAATTSVDGYLKSTDWTTFNNKQAALSLTTTGTSGAATLVGATLNIPNYGSALSGYVPTSRQLTINGTAFNLSADRTWNVGTVTSVTGTAPVNVATGTSTPVISLASGYGDTQNPYTSKTAHHILAAPIGTAGVPTFRAIVAADIPTLNQSTTGNAATVTTNANLTGPVTSIGNATAIANGAISNAMLANAAVANLSGTNTGDQTITLSGDVTGSGTGSFNATIANGAVTLPKMANLAAHTIIGNNTGTSATPLALSGTYVTAMLDVFNGTTKGLVPVPSGPGTNVFLAADGTWQKIATSAIADQSQKTLLANTTASSGAVSAVAISSITTELSNVVGDGGSGGTKGLVPAPASGDAAAGKFLKADGLWAVPTTTIGTNVVTNAMLAQVATAIFKGRTSAGTGNVEDLTVTQATAMLNLFSTAATTKGLVPGSNGVANTNFLRADGTWAVPAGGGGGGGTTTNPLIIKADSGTTEGTDLYTFDGSSAKTINIVAGTNITITKTAGTLTISSTGGSSSAVSSDHPVTLMTAFLNYT